MRSIDMTCETAEVHRYRFDPPEAIASLHVLAPDGIGWVNASTLLGPWEQLPRYRWLTPLLEALRLVPLMDWAYARLPAQHFT